MAPGAAAGAFEIRAARLCVAALEVVLRYLASRAEHRPGVLTRAMHEGDDRADLRVGEIERRHALVGTAAFDQRTHLVAAHVLLDECRSRQVGPGLAAHRVAAVTEAAVRGKQRLSVRGNPCRGGLRRACAPLRSKRAGKK